MAKLVLSNADALGLLKGLPALRWNLVNMVGMALDSLRERQVGRRGWARVYVTPGTPEHSELLTEAHLRVVELLRFKVFAVLVF